MPSHDTHVPDPWDLGSQGAQSGPPRIAKSSSRSGRTPTDNGRRSAARSHVRSDFRLGPLFTSGAETQRLERASTAVQRPLGTGRRMALGSVEGGSGKSTLTALLGLAFSSLRPDTTAVIDVAREAGTLAQRLGTEDGLDLDSLATHAAGATLDREALGGLMACPAPQLLTTAPRTSEPQPDQALDRTATTLSRYCPVTLYDCGPGLASNPSALWAVRASHAVIVVVRAGSPQTSAAARWAASSREYSGATGLVAVVETDGRGRHSAQRAAASLSAAGIDAFPIGHDRHIAASGVLQLQRVRPPVRLQIIELAAHMLERSGGVDDR